VMTGELTLSIDNDERRLLGCQELTPGKSFSFLLGDVMNRLWYVLREPFTMETTNGFLVKVKSEDICKIGTGLNPQTIEFFADIRMNLNRISNLREPVNSDEAATKSYCDNRARKIYNGYIPQMTSFGGRMNEKMGFKATGSSERCNNYTADNPFNGFYSEGHGGGGEWATLRETRD